jgi:hypothetical protein
MSRAARFDLLPDLRSSSMIIRADPAMSMRFGASRTPTFHPSAGKSPTRRSRGFFIRKFCRKSAIIALIYLLDRFHRVFPPVVTIFATTKMRKGFALTPFFNFFGQIGMAMQASLSICHSQFDLF